MVKKIMVRSYYLLYISQLPSTRSCINYPPPSSLRVLHQPSRPATVDDRSLQGWRVVRLCQGKGKLLHTGRRAVVSGECTPDKVLASNDRIFHTVQSSKDSTCCEACDEEFSQFHLELYWSPPSHSLDKTCLWTPFFLSRKQFKIDGINTSRKIKKPQLHQAQNLNN